MVTFADDFPRQDEIPPAPPLPGEVAIKAFLAGDSVLPPLGDPLPELTIPWQTPTVKPGYETLAGVLVEALHQAQSGKGHERHANGLPFEEQPMASINETLGSIDGYLFQAHKKSMESRVLPHDRAVAELLGAINYLAGAVLHLRRHA